MQQNIAVCLLAFSVSQSISQSASLPNQPLQFLSVDRAEPLCKSVFLSQKSICVSQVAWEGWVTLFIFIRRVWSSIYHSPPRNIRNFKDLKNTWNLQPPKNPWRKEKTLKCIEITPEYSPISWWTPPPSKKKIHISSYPQKCSFLWG